MMTEDQLVRRDFRAMNSDIELTGWGPGIEGRLQRAERWLAAYEDRYSRFRLLSELSRLNAAAGRPVRVSKGLLQLVELSLQLARRSGGLFDPTVLRDLEVAGYDRSFELIRTPGTPKRDRSSATWRDIVVDAVARTVTLPADIGIDPGGIGKGWAVDRMAAILGTPCLVNGGGDVFAGGQPPDEDCWRVGIAAPFQPQRDIAVLRVVNRGVATSSTVKRRWRVGNAVLHHLVDPRTGRPSTSDAVQVTVIASTAMLADYHAKVALLQGADGALAYLNADPDVEGMIVRSDGDVLATSDLRQYIEG